MLGNLIMILEKNESFCNKAFNHNKKIENTVNRMIIDSLQYLDSIYIMNRTETDQNHS